MDAGPHEDDGIPVLTDVIRLGTGPVAPPHRANVEALPDDGPPAASLVIGSEAPPADERADGVAPPVVVEDVPSTPSEGAADATDAPSVAALPSTDVADDAAVDEVREPTSVDRTSTTDPPLADEAALVDASKPPPADDAASAARWREAVLDDLAGRIDTELDARLAPAMRTAGGNARAGRQVELREHLGDALRDVVRRAVDDEMARARVPGPPSKGAEAAD